jgi:hypothetical protein
MREIRNFIVSNNPDLANLLRNMGEGDIGGVASSDINSVGGPVAANAARQLALLFSAQGSNFAQLGVNAALFGGDAGRIDNAILWALHNNSLINANEIIANGNVKTKSVFGVSPYIALKAGYFFDEINACLYLKAGMIQLTGRITPTNDFYTIKNNSFRKSVPFFAVGLSKNFNEKWGINIELSKTMKARKNLAISIPYGGTIKNNTEINKIGLAFVVTYRF